MMTNECKRAEVTAGALALGEATDVQRDDYRRHIAQCGSCLTNLGGEHDIAATMNVVARARDEERWQPEARIVLRHQTRPNRIWKFGFGALAVASVAWIGVYLFAPRAPMMTLHATVAANVPAAPHAQRHDTRGHDLVVVHNVATLRRPPLPAPAPRAVAIAPAPVRIPAVEPRAHRAPAAHAPSVVAVTDPSLRDEGSVSAQRNVGTAPAPAERAESIAVLPPPGITHDVIPLGGEDAIVPHPPAIAYYENAEGTTTFEVSVDERGMPMKCSVTKSSGFLVLDEAVCAAALRVRYSPRTINGRAVPGVYRDALTFQQTGDR